MNSVCHTKLLITMWLNVPSIATCAKLKVRWLSDGCHDSAAFLLSNTDGI